MKRLLCYLLLFVSTVITVPTVFATEVDRNQTPGQSQENVSQKDSNITLDGMIGPYDPNAPDSDSDPNFEDIEIEGQLPTDNYYTIAVTVPLAMEFLVLPHDINVRGQFYSAKYSVKNNATRPVHISVTTVISEQNPQSSDTTVPLYLEKPVNGDGRMQIDLDLLMFNNNTQTQNNVNLTELASINKLTTVNYLGVLGLKDTGYLQFDSTNWEWPGVENLARDISAVTNFDVQLEFSLQDPTLESQPSS